MKTLRGLSIVPLLPFLGMALITQNAAAQLQGGSVQHDPTRPYRAWVMCVDRSLSPTNEQFRKSLAVMEEITEKDITFNDLVWLIDIQGTAQPAKLFAMPASTYRRSAGNSAAEALRQTKAQLVKELWAMSQVSGSTDLKDPLEAALIILRGHAVATARILVMGSDFLTDTSTGQVSLAPPKPIRTASAAGVSAWLIVTYPKASYLRKLRLSQSDLLTEVEDKWTANLRERGACCVNVRPVDSIPAVARNREPMPGK